MWAVANGTCSNSLLDFYDSHCFRRKTKEVYTASIKAYSYTYKHNVNFQLLSTSYLSFLTSIVRSIVWLC